MDRNVFSLLIRTHHTIFYAHVRLCGGYGGTIAWHICSANFDYPPITTRKLVLNEGKVGSDAANS